MTIVYQCLTPSVESSRGTSPKGKGDSYEENKIPLHSGKASEAWIDSSISKPGLEAEWECISLKSSLN